MTCAEYDVGVQTAHDKNPSTETELAFYEQHKNEWLPEHENEFIVIAGTKIAGFYADYTAAWDAGAQRFGAESPFLIKQVLPLNLLVLV